MAHDLKSQVEAATLAALAAVGGDPGAIKKADIVREFVAKGGKRATIFAWIGRVLAEKTPRDVLGKVPSVVAKARAPVFSADVAAAAPQGFDRIVGPSGTGLVEALEKCMKAADDVMQHSRHADGKVRLGKTLLLASEHMRRTMETATRVYETMVALQKLDAFYEALNVELEHESPEVAARVIARLRAISDRWRLESQPL